MAPEFELLEHTSDVGLLARGRDREEALLAASQGLVSLLVNPEPFRALEERYFKAAGIDEAAQIVNWLNEILFFFDTEGMVFVDFAIDFMGARGNYRPRKRRTLRHRSARVSHSRQGRDVSSIREPLDCKRLGDSSIRGCVV